MATLTEQMENLAADITSGRQERRAWIEGLRDQVGAMRQEFHADQQGARTAWQRMAGNMGMRPSGAARMAARPKSGPRSH